MVLVGEGGEGRRVWGQGSQLLWLSGIPSHPWTWLLLVTRDRPKAVAGKSGLTLCGWVGGGLRLIKVS